MNRLRFKFRWPRFSTGTKGIEEGIAEKGGGWDGLELGKRYAVFVMSVPGQDELTEAGKPKMPICRIKDKDGKFKGRYIVTEIYRPVTIGEELSVIVNSVATNVVFATAE